jgi:hypothetical protein
VLFTARGWGASWPRTRFLLSELPPFSMRLFRGSCGCLFAIAVALVRG